jgi:TatD DNase family protein
MEYQVIDVHAHLCDPVFDPDRAEVLERARRAGVVSVIAVGEDLADARKNIDLSKKHPMIRAAAGLYPTRLSLEQAREMHQLIRDNKEKLVAVGEVGLDYWMIKEELQLELQREIFSGFIDLAKELDLPLNVHSRSAGRHTIALLLGKGAKRVHLHAFDGKAGSAVAAVEAGYYFSVPPSVVRSEQKQKLVKCLPLSCLLLETDSPVLGPLPNARNEPANIIVALKAVAGLKGISEADAAAAIRENTLRLYGTV